jgi:ParB/RepB/Spo0J family partition protein
MIVKCCDIIAEPQDNTSRGEANRMNPQDCMDLAKSIEVHGQLQPVLVKEEDGKYRLAAGFRRFTAMSIILGLEEIEVKVVPAHFDAAKLNMVENIQRRDLTFWEECCMLRENYPDDVVLKNIQDELGMSKTWVNTRWKATNLPEEVTKQIEAGLLGYSDVLMLVQKGVDAERAAEKLILAKAAGKSSESMQKEILNRKNLRGKKTIQRVMTRCLEGGFNPAVQALRYAIGEIEEETLMKYLRKD